MPDPTISDQLRERVPGFKVGIISYRKIRIGNMPPEIAERLPLFYENIRLSLEDQPVAAIPAVREWRAVFKKAGTDPSHYRPSQEALLRRIRRDGCLPTIHSAVDLNNFFSVQHSIPLGIYDADRLRLPVEIRIGGPADRYEALNGRIMEMKGKICSADNDGAFGSPIVDSQRTAIGKETKNALQVVYLRPSMADDEAEKLIRKIAEMFTQVHGGENEWMMIH
ncbi:MAG: hypothetical protein LKI80_14940 [Sporolactobacillus sp.]|jgi:DNA/RNA-binding domain of Phe-tRNA-synthetase-like protein|nr:hypothetical protein [Sporolactobacillus sp.]